MASANSISQFVDLDFDSIKNNLKAFLKTKDVLKDYNYEGSALSVLLDILAYNTQYNAYYLNMTANELFMDTAIQRTSVVSQAKLLNYTPTSRIAPQSTVNVVVGGVTDASLTMPRYTNFMSEAIDGVNYNFVNSDSYTVNVVNNVATFSNVVLRQGKSTTLNFTVDSAQNPKYIFSIPEENIDTTTLVVTVQESSTNTATTIYNKADDYLTIDEESLVYFLQEGDNNYYEVYFGDGIVGKKLSDQNIVKVNFIVTDSTLSHGANNFILLNTIGGYSNTQVFPLTEASNGAERETIESIKFQAPKNFAAQNRAVTKNDYMTLIQQNKLGITFDSVSVWGGEENDPPLYGTVFISLKPTGAYDLTTTQKQRLVEEVIKPISVLTVTPQIVDPDYVYVQLTINVYYDPNKTTQTSGQIQEGVKQSVLSFATNTLNTFNSTFNSYSLLTYIQNYSSSIITTDYEMRLQKKFYPNLSVATNYKFLFNTQLQKGVLTSGVGSSPGLTFKDPLNPALEINNVQIEEYPSLTYGVESISIINPGFNYQSTPTITITGDGTGATATATISAGSIRSVTVTNAGNNYTSAIATVTPAEGDLTGQLGALVVNLEGRYGTLRTFYNSNTAVKTILKQNVGTIDYNEGVVTLNSFNPIDIDNPLGNLTISVKPKTTTISSTYNRIITIDPYDSASVVVNVISQPQ